MSLIDFTTAANDVSTKYGGSDQKRSILYENERYMIKLSDRLPEEKRNPLNSSYTNSAFSEHVSCKIIALLGIPVQETLLGTVTTRSSKSGEPRVHPVVACKNFLKSNEELIEFKVIESALLAEKPSKTPKITDIYDLMLNENAYFSHDFGKIALARYWDNFIIDALLGNFDRHANNWGYIVNRDTHEISLAPIYDCGSCLYPKIADEAIPDILNNPEEIKKRIDVFPNAALLLEDGKKASYKQLISSLENQDCNDALKRIYPRIDMTAVHNLIENMDELSDIRKQFYKTMITERYEQILSYAYEKLMQQDLSIDEEEIEL